MPKCLSCNKRAWYNKRYDKVPMYCRNHKTTDMYHCYKQLCTDYSICNIYASYNYKDKDPMFCKKHAEIDMINVADLKCKTCNKKRPNYNYIGMPAKFCKKCSLDKMINVKSKLCVSCEKKQPTYNYEGSSALYCSTCKHKNMVNVKDKKCIICKKSKPYFSSVDNNNPIYCGKCKPNGYVNLRNLLCIICNKSQPSFNIHGLKAEYCNKCKTTDMVNVKHKKCDYCQYIRANPKYKPHCALCYYFLNPNSEFTRNYKIKENTIMKFVKESYPNCILDSTIAGGCSKRRPDGLIEFNLFSIIIEIDEDSHKSYEDICENRRLMEIYQDLSFKPLRVIRFNPDNYKEKDGKTTKSIFSLDSEKKLKVRSKKELNRRVEKLLSVVEEVSKSIDENIDFNDVKSIIVKYLFFDEN
jgi:hypothetical protein